MKKLLEYVSIICTIILFLPKVYADEIDPIPAVHTDVVPGTTDTTHYNDFIYFFEEYNDIKDIKNGTTTRAGFYKTPPAGYYGPTAEIVQLRRNCNGVENCLTFGYFYEKIDELTKPNSNNRYPITIRANGIDNVCNLYEIIDTPIMNGDGTETINSHYYHGCWSDVNGGQADLSTLQGNANTNDVITSYSSPENKNGMICSSVNRNVTPPTPRIEDDYVSFIIERKGPTDVEDAGPIGLQNNCNGDGVNRIDAFSRRSVGDNKTVKYGSPVIVSFKYDVNTYSCSPEKSDITGPCNEQTVISQKCNDKTIDIDEKNRVNISLEQTARVNNHIEQNEIYQGGGLNIGYELYIDINWNYKSIESRDGKSNDEIKAIINEQLASQIRSNINKINFDFDIEGMQNSRYLQEIKNMMNDTRTCELTHSGEKATVYCYITPQVTELNKFMGTINYSASFIGDRSINNKIYADINYSGNYNISMNFSGINMLSESDDDNWTINIEDPDTENGSCSVNIYPKIYEEPSSGDKLSVKFMPIYRPISIFDPFPNGRNPGVNWERFYADQPDRLSESYLNSNLQFSVELNPNVIREIKTTITEPYSDWGGIDPVTKESEFVSKYFTTVRQHIPEDDK